MSPLRLDGLRVLVTRPELQANHLCTQLQAMGAKPIPFPTLEIVPVDDSDASAATLRQIFLNLDHYHAVLFVSANAARYGWQWIDQYWPQLPVGIHWLAVGRATAETLAQLGIPASSNEGAMDSEALLTTPELQHLEHAKVLICRGEGGREHLKEVLVSRGAEVDYAELYRRQPPAYDAQEIESRIYQFLPSAILVSSGEALTNLMALTQGHQLLDQVLVVPSVRVAQQAQGLGFERVITAANATDDAMITALVGVVSQDTSERG